MAEVEKKRKRTRKLTVDRILAGDDMIELVERAKEVALDPATEGMVLMWKHDGVVTWRNAGMSTGDLVFTCEDIKFAVFQGGDDAD